MLLENGEGCLLSKFIIFFTREGGGVSNMKLLENVGQIQIGAFKYPAYYCYFVISFVHSPFSESINKTLKMWGNVGYFNNEFGMKKLLLNNE